MISYGGRRMSTYAIRSVLCFFVAQGLLWAAPGMGGENDLARERLAAYHAASQQPAERRLHLVCWRPQDRNFAAGHRDRLDRIMTDIQAFYAREMQRHGLGTRSIRLDRNAEGRLVIHEVVGHGRFADYGKSDGQRIRAECLPVLRDAGIDADRETVMIFTNLADWDPANGRFQHKSPYYAGGSHLSGTAWQLDSPELDTRNLPLKMPVIQDGEYGRISLGKHNSIFIGGIAHELGHALGLPHCRARADEEPQGTALMGSGNRTYADERRHEGKGTFLTRAHALRLASHPQFSGSVTGMLEDPQGQFDGLAVEPADDGRSFTITGRLQARIPVYAVIAYLDPEGGGDYDARTEVAIPDEVGQFTLRCASLVAGRPAGLRLVACHCNGGVTQLDQAFGVAEDGQVDVVSMQLAFLLQPFVDVLPEGPRRAAEMRDALPDGSDARRIASTVLDALTGRRLRQPSDAVADSEVQVPLSSIEPREASVGWLQPAYDRLPRPDPLLRCGSDIFETGIYAHAPSRYQYDLQGGWRRLEGACGLPPQAGGSVVFVIRGDGRELYRSPRIGPGVSERFRVDIANVARLELVTEDGGDGKAADWGVWGEPTLLRDP
jgi:hypothetical protein